MKLKTFKVMDFRHKIFIDGGTYDNSICIIDKKLDMVYTESFPRLNKTDATEMEFRAMLAALKHIQDNDFRNTEVYVYTDNKTLYKYVKAINGNAWSMKKDTLSQLKNEVHQKINDINMRSKKLKLIFRWVNRKVNPAGIELDKRKKIQKQMERLIYE